MTTIQQRLDFITELRESYDREQRERIVVKRSPEQVAKLLRDIHDDLHGMKLLQLNPKQGEFCSDCNKLLTPANRVNFAVADSHIVVNRNEHVCEACTRIRIERLKNQPNV